MAKKPRNKKYNQHKTIPLVRNVASVVAMKAKTMTGENLDGDLLPSALQLQISEYIRGAIDSESINVDRIRHLVFIAESLLDMQSDNAKLRTGLRLGRRALRQILQLPPNAKAGEEIEFDIRTFVRAMDSSLPYTTKAQMDYAQAIAVSRGEYANRCRMSVFGALEAMQYHVRDVEFRTMSHWYRVARNLGHTYGLPELSAAAEAGCKGLTMYLDFQDGEAAPNGAYRLLRRMARAIDRSLIFIPSEGLATAEKDSQNEFWDAICQQLTAFEPSYPAFDTLINGGTIAKAANGSKSIRSDIIKIAQCLSAMMSSSIIKIPNCIPDIRTQQDMLCSLWNDIKEVLRRTKLQAA